MWSLCFVTTSSEEKEAALSLLGSPDRTHCNRLLIPLMEGIRIGSTEVLGPLITQQTKTYHLKFTGFFFFLVYSCSSSDILEKKSFLAKLNA